MGTRRTHQEDLRRPACGAASPPKLGAAGIKVDRRMLGESGRRPRHLRSGTIAGLPVHRGPYARRAQWMLPESCHPRPTGCGRSETVASVGYADANLSRTENRRGDRALEPCWTSSAPSRSSSWPVLARACGGSLNSVGSGADEDRLAALLHGHLWAALMASQGNDASGTPDSLAGTRPR